MARDKKDDPPERGKGSLLKMFVCAMCGQYFEEDEVRMPGDDTCPTCRVGKLTEVEEPFA